MTAGLKQNLVIFLSLSVYEALEMVFEQGNEVVQAKLAEREDLATQSLEEAKEGREKAAAEKQALDLELTALQKKLKEAEQANARLDTESAAQKAKLDGKIQNQRQVALRFVWLNPCSFAMGLDRRRQLWSIHLLSNELDYDVMPLPNQQIY